MPGKIKKFLMKNIEYTLCHRQGIVNLLQSNASLRSATNTWLMNQAIAKAPFRPYALSTLSDFTSWDSLTDRTYSGRHLPPLTQAEIDKLPEIPRSCRSSSGRIPE